jgi:hypothetical protein
MVELAAFLGTVRSLFWRCGERLYAAERASSLRGHVTVKLDRARMGRSAASPRMWRGTGSRPDGRNPCRTHHQDGAPFSVSWRNRNSKALMIINGVNHTLTPAAVSSPDWSNVKRLQASIVATSAPVFVASRQIPIAHTDNLRQRGYSSCPAHSRMIA